MSRKDRRVAAKQKQRNSARPGTASPGAAKPAAGGASPAAALFQQVVRLHQAGRLAEAEAGYRQVLALDPRHINALNNLGIALRQQGRMEEALAAYGQVLALKPDFSDAWYNMGVALQKLGRMEEAGAAYQDCLRLKPDHVSAVTNLGVVIGALGRIEDAITCYRHALDLNPGHGEAYINLGGALERAGRLGEARAALQRALELSPHAAEVLSNLGNVLKSQGRLDEAVAAYRQGLAASPDFVEIHCNLLFSLNYRDDVTPEEVFRAHLEWAERFERPRLERPRPPHTNVPDPERRLRVGYVSPDFRTHSVAHFFEPLLAAHDRAAVEVFCYAEVTEVDAVTHRLRGMADHWRPTVGAPDEDVAGQIRRDGIDVLVDLAGHTGKNRLPVFAFKPAPVQVTWLGYPNTTGMRAIDFRITDPVADPMGDADRFHTEILARLPTGFLCYRAPADAGEVAPLPAASGAPLTFGSFNNLTKVTAEVVRVWSAVLQRVPGSRLKVKSIAFADAETRQRYLDLFAAQGVDLARVELLERIPTQAGHLAAYGQIDIALDTFPYNGTTTTCEALWMGVPVVTLRGRTHAARVGASLATVIGLPGLVADTEAAYVELAARLAADLPGLAALRAGLRGRMAASPLCDAPRFARTMETAYRLMWRRWCGQAATAGAVPA